MSKERSDATRLRSAATSWNLSFNSFHERRLARKAGIESLLGHSQLGGEIVHADSSEAVDEKLPPGRGDHVPCDDRSACPLLSFRVLGMHGNTMETIVYYKFPSVGVNLVRPTGQGGEDGSWSMRSQDRARFIFFL